MSKLFAFEMITLDGYFEGPDHDIDWHNVDAEFNEFAVNQTGQAGTLVFGRITYELMASYWPADAAKTDDPEVANQMNATPKIVFSHTLQSADWQNTTLLKDNAAEELKKLKQASGKDIAIFGSSNLCANLVNEDPDLIDEYRLMVNPVIIGAGTPFLHGINQQLKLNLASTRQFKNGNLLLTYRPA
jgi:dihydrofolate reductase